jgi:hypothetical protein
MITHHGEMERRLKAALTVSAVGCLLLILGFLLAASQILAFFFVLIVVLALSWPAHARIGLILCMTTYSASILLPFAKGRPLIWELAAAMTWSGLPVLYALRKQHPAAGTLFHRNKLLVLLPFCYCLVLLFLIKIHGVHFGNFTTAGAGGRRYAQQFVCAILPLLFISVVPGEKLIQRLFVIQGLLSFTYVGAELALNFGKGDTRYLLAFFDLTNDAVGFASNAISGGIQRFQSFYHFVIAMLGLILMWVPMASWFTMRRFWVIPLVLVTISTGLLSGHRYIIYGAGTLLLGSAWAQKFFNAGRVFWCALLGGILVGVAYLAAPALPDSAQRALTLLPGIDVRPHVEFDARATLEGRSELFRVAYDLIPTHLWVGRGFGMTQEAIDMLARADGVIVDTYTMYSGLGVFYNGTLGFMVNTGIPGTLVMMLFMIMGSILSFRVFGLLRKNEWDDCFSRLAGISATFYLSQMFTTIFLHGDADAVMRSLGMQTGLLLVMEYHLKQRISRTQEEALATVEPTETQSPSASPLIDIPSALR